MGVVPDVMNSSRRVVSLDQGSLGLARPLLLQRGRETSAYRQFMLDTALLLGATKEQVCAGVLRQRRLCSIYNSLKLFTVDS